jgi:hypothetical protein
MLYNVQFQQKFSFSAQREASEHFRQLHVKAARRKLWSRLVGRRSALLHLSDVPGHHQLMARPNAGVQQVRIDLIRGSEGRADDFDVDFRPLNGHQKERWVSIAVARSQDVPLPPVNLVQVGDYYYVRDGHHRISVAKAEGQVEIDAEVMVWQGTHPTEAQQTTAGCAATLPLFDLSRIGVMGQPAGVWMAPVTG